MRTPTRYKSFSGQPRLLLGMDLLNLCIQRAKEEEMSVSEYVRSLIVLETQTGGTALPA